jgi:hypothetical protein
VTIIIVQVFDRRDTLNTSVAHKCLNHSQLVLSNRVAESSVICCTQNIEIHRNDDHLPHEHRSRMPDGMLDNRSLCGNFIA